MERLVRYTYMHIYATHTSLNKAASSSLAPMSRSFKFDSCSYRVAVSSCTGKLIKAVQGQDVKSISWGSAGMIAANSGIKLVPLKHPDRLTGHVK